VHHGDGVEALFLEDSSVLTCSIHEDPRTLWPGTGGVRETAAEDSSVNVPVLAHADGETWLWSFREGILPALRRFDPGAIVLQMGTDTHYSDPLAHIQSTAQHWLGAVREVQGLGKPIVAVGGGGYQARAVPRMWAAAVLTLAGIRFEDELPSDLAEAWGIPRYFDPVIPVGHPHAMEFAQTQIAWLRQHHALFG
jgi:acetoin utilization protein AcuC